VYCVSMPGCRKRWQQAHYAIGETPVNPDYQLMWLLASRQYLNRSRHDLAYDYYFSFVVSRDTCGPTDNHATREPLL